MNTDETIAKAKRVIEDLAEKIRDGFLGGIYEASLDALSECVVVMIRQNTDLMAATEKNEELLKAGRLALIELNFLVEVAGRGGGLYEKAREQLRDAIIDGSPPASKKRDRVPTEVIARMLQHIPTTETQLRSGLNDIALRYEFLILPEQYAEAFRDAAEVLFRRFPKEDDELTSGWQKQISDIWFDREKS